MNLPLSCIIITKNAAGTLEETLRSVEGFAAETIIVDDESTDETRSIAARYSTTVIPVQLHHEARQRKRAFEETHYPWILCLDSDEVVSDDLKEEIQTIITSGSPPCAYRVPYRNHLFGYPVTHGGETYTMVRFFHRDVVTIDDHQIHSQFHPLHNEVPLVSGCILHYSYRSLGQMYRKFSAYAKREARRKRACGETTGPAQLILYPLHMIWARYIEDGGYRDGPLRIILDLFFGYMEFRTYWEMLWISSVDAISNPETYEAPQQIIPVSITVLYHSSDEEKSRFLSDSKRMGCIAAISVDNSKTGKGYAEGLNAGITYLKNWCRSESSKAEKKPGSKSVSDDAITVELFADRIREPSHIIIQNPDIDLTDIVPADLKHLAKKYAVGGFAMNQDGTTYYGGEIDRMRMSGGMTVTKPDNRFVEVDFVSGSFMLIDRKVIMAIGLFEERFGMYYEDVEYCVRAKKAGYPVGIDSACAYKHFEVSRTNNTKRAILERARIRFLVTEGSFKQYLYELFRTPKTIFEYMRGR